MTGDALRHGQGETNAGYDPSWYEHLYEIEEGHFWFRGRNRVIVWAIEKFFPSAASFLEIGCGTGYVLKGIETAFPHIKLAGSEYHEEGLQYAAKRVSRAELFRMDALNIPFRESYDVIGLFDVLEHIEDDRAVLAQVYNAVRPGGGVLITVPQHRFMWSAEDEWAGHARRYERAEIVDKVRQAGFTVRMLTSFASLVFPAMLASRLVSRLKRKFDYRNTFRVAEPLNTIFDKALSLELALIRRGARFPFGGSLILAAGKPAFSPDRGNAA